MEADIKRVARSRALLLEVLDRLAEQAEAVVTEYREARRVSDQQRGPGKEYEFKWIPALRVRRDDGKYFRFLLEQLIPVSGHEGRSQKLRQKYIRRNKHGVPYSDTTIRKLTDQLDRELVRSHYRRGRFLEQQSERVYRALQEMTKVLEEMQTFRATAPAEHPDVEQTTQTMERAENG